MRHKVKAKAKALEPEHNIDYVMGRCARLTERDQTTCPYSRVLIGKRCLWLAGWNDADMEQTA